ncbi:leucine--tRNA ligase [Buchnera aphidicola]|uniref:Leucine--tRNA ligase n=1 Tax=Buchnera aphidicola subsp. Cinara cedri (strain Cc) TaxID=372461 RepID=SYL_BUCCC|nr:leucine--tRNA ligase [Buchnera aphidicola]Q057G3.1 RecName: Full=Leucine--tRNA ligase; AltName: Full=Leucyl-tRNA synthetase; Short=LeuRS [Buchnera aphidicola BCc]ABJ90736.1 leucyl-tRNA synthetase [Buchnera aphidicola BCc]
MKNNNYNPKKIEKYVQKYWVKKKIFFTKIDKEKKKFYCLPMLPYPSGKLHMGHVRNYTISDVISRFHRMLGKNVLQPIGWDSFGLPAEETAIKNNISPKKWTFKNIKTMKKQLQSLGFSYDWNKEITTCNPEYYRWEQLFFIKLFKKKLIYKKKSIVNWCEKDKTVLANEQVQKGVCWRCGTKIKLRKISQWFIKIKKYADKFLKDLKLLKKWPKEVISMQKNWIGKSKGLKIKCKIYKKKYFLKIFTTKPETIMGISFFAISMYHPLINLFLRKNIEIQKFLKKNKYSINTEFQKSNILFGINTHLYVIHPINKKKIPLWISNYVKYNYATGAIMSVPCSNKIDYNFSKLYNIPFIKIFSKKNKKLLINSDNFNNLNIKKARNKISNFLINKKIAKKYIYYKIQDWCISRQRYWGTPIPIVIDNKKNIITVPKKKLPVILPKYIYKKKSLQSLSLYSLWLKTKISGKKVTRETDTLDTFMESSWYYARYTNPKYEKDIIDPKASEYWLPVDQYIGGIEHAVMHLIYFRFYHKLLYDFGYVQSKEPVKKLICQGMVIIDSFYKYNKDGSKKWLSISKIEINRDSKGKIISAIEKSSQKKIIYAGKIKMSKSKNNGIDPVNIIKQYGADSLRLFIMFAAPINISLEWNSKNIIGMHRFLKKIWNFVFIIIKKKKEKIKKIDLNKNKKTYIYKLNTIIKKVTYNIQERNSFNTAIAEIIKFFNYLVKLYKIYNIKKKNLIFCISTIIKMLYPFTPHICFILWKKIYGKKSCIEKETWPKFNKKFFLKEKNNIIIQINGKKKDIMKIHAIISKKEIIKLILKNEKIKKHLYKKIIKKTIYIPNKVINFVL